MSILKDLLHLPARAHVQIVWYFFVNLGWIIPLIASFNMAEGNARSVTSIVASIWMAGVAIHGWWTDKHEDDEEQMELELDRQDREKRGPR